MNLIEMRCDMCGNPAIIHQRYSGAHLCFEHFCKSVEKRVRRYVRDAGIIKRCNHIAVGVSGGKDSSTLLYQMHSILKNNNSVKLTAIQVDEGIGSYRPITASSALRLCDQLGIELECVSFEEIWGITVDDIVSRKGEDVACAYCGVLRRWVLNKKAREIGAQSICTGHNLDDEAQSILLNVLDNDTSRLVRLGQPKRSAEMVPRYKPLSFVPEQEIALYAIIKDIPHKKSVCPYHGSSVRNDVRDLLLSYEEKHPGTMYSIIRFYRNVQPLLATEIENKTEAGESGIGKCGKCGEPSSSTICRACSIISEFF